MHIREIKFEYEEFGAVEELPLHDRSLIMEARKAAESAYAPYSKFSVGAAVLLANGETITGSNQENVDFTDGLCAERVALFYAHARFPDVAVEAIAITAKNASAAIVESAQPCGSCRQVMVESEFRAGKPMRIILDGAAKIQVLKGADCLLPLPFRPTALG